MAELLRCDQCPYMEQLPLNHPGSRSTRIWRRVVPCDSHTATIQQAVPELHFCSPQCIAVYFTLHYGTEVPAS